MISFDNSHPVILVLTGLPGVGKSTLANAIAPPISSSFVNEKDGFHPIHWLEVSTLPPLQRLLATQTRIEGEQSQDRKKYETLHALLELFGNSPLFGAPAFDNLIAMVRRLTTWNFDSDAAYLQYARDMIESYDPDILFKRLDQTIATRFGGYKHDVAIEMEDIWETEPNQDLQPKLFGVVAPDVQNQEELLWLLEKPNSMILNLMCDEDIRQERLASQDRPDREYPLVVGHLPTVTLDTSTKVERMLLNGEELPMIEDDLKRGKSKAKNRAFRRLLAEEFNDLITEFRNIFALETIDA